MQSPERQRQETLHRGGRETQGDPQAGTPGLQVPAEEAEADQASLRRRASATPRPQRDVLAPNETGRLGVQSAKQHLRLPVQLLVPIEQSPATPSDTVRLRSPRPGHELQPAGGDRQRVHPRGRFGQQRFRPVLARRQQPVLLHVLAQLHQERPGGGRREQQLQDHEEVPGRRFCTHERRLRRVGRRFQQIPRASAQLCQVREVRAHELVVRLFGQHADYQRCFVLQQQQPVFAFLPVFASEVRLHQQHRHASDQFRRRQH